MPFNPKNGECLCHRCGKWWKSTQYNGLYVEPKSCAGCKSKVWNQSRKYNLGTLESSLIVVKRDKPTGRAAKKLKRVVIETEEFNIKVGDIITTSWGTGPYEVIKVTETKKQTYSLTLVLPGTKKDKGGGYRESDLFWVNNVTREGDRYPSFGDDEVFVQKAKTQKPKNYLVNDCGVFTEYETIIITQTKRFYFELRLSTKDDLWYVGYHYQLGMSKVGDYAESCLPFPTGVPYKNREEAITLRLCRFAEDYSENYKDISIAAKQFLEKLPASFSAFEQFKPTLERLRKEGLKSDDSDWWKSRWYEFIGYAGNDSYSERIQKNDLEKLFPIVWQIYQGELTKI